ncbi:phosphoribosylglycinamide formyltransferase [Panacagrimonas perspica]|uniref:phosphoribosylglycinamide formyltransferase n=1 Tax=Panacagrimonas perspica TaxID=381431 RepID=UPI00344D3E6F
MVALVSGQGRNLQALIDACSAGHIAGDLVGVLSNRAAAPALARAQAAGIATRVVPHDDYPDREAFDTALAASIDAFEPGIVVLGGFMRVLGDAFVQRYTGRMINIHPSLLPRYPGLRTHQRALEAGDAEHGATVHFVTGQLDGGAPVIQGRVSVQAEDSPEILASRVMNEVEIRILPQTVAWMAEGALSLGDTRALLRGEAIETPLQLADLDERFR